jgi:hypothetical protein
VQVGITQDDLLGALRRVFVASPEFASLFLKLVFESITAPGDENKVQCFDTLGQCAARFSSEALAPFVSHMYVTHLAHLAHLVLECLSENQMSTTVERVRRLMCADRGAIPVDTRRHDKNSLPHLTRRSRWHL